MKQDRDTSMGGSNREFPATRHTLIRAAASGEAPSREALEAIVATYWKPAYKHIRGKWRRSNDDAKDLVQGFFSTLLEQDILERFDPARGSFRNYLRTCLDHYVLKQHESASRQKRGGAMLTLDFDEAERELGTLAASTSPEEIFHREWQRQIFTLAIDDLRRDCAATGHDLHFRLFETYDLGDARLRYADLAQLHGITETAVVNYLAWARRELRRHVLRRLAGTTASDSELRSESRALFGPSEK